MYEDSQEIDGRIEQVNKEERRIIRQTGTRVLQRLMGRKFRRIFLGETWLKYSGSVQLCPAKTAN